MTELIVLRILGDVCLYFAVIGSFPLFFAHDFMLLYPALLCAAGAGAAQMLEGKRLNYLALLLPLASLLLADEIMEYLILAPALVYTGAVILRGAFEMDYYGFRDLYLNALKLLALFGSVVFAMGYFEGMFGSSWDAYDVSALLLYGLIFGFTGVFLLRQLRLGPDSLPRDRLANNIQMVVVLAVILGLSALTAAMEEYLQGFFTWILNTAIGVVMIIPMIIHELMRWFFADKGAAYFEAVEAAKPSTSETVEYTFPAYTGPPPPPPSEEQFPWWLAILVLAVLCVVFYFLLRTLGKGSRSAAREEEPETVVAPGMRKREQRRSNRGKVRKLYREYLKMVRRKGQKLETYQTTADILEKHPQNTDTEAAARLRQVYLKARYDTGKAVTDEDVEQAKAAMKAVTNHHKVK